MSSITYRWLPTTEIWRLSELDRRESIDMNYRVQDGTLLPVSVQWQVPGWSITGDGDHSVNANIAFVQGHITAGGEMIGGFADNILVGLGVLTPDIRPRLAQLAFLHVSRSYRRRGIGCHLTQAMIKRARELGSKNLYVSATPSRSAVEFYLSQGFRLTDHPIPELYALEPDDIHMVLSLDERNASIASVID